MTNHIPKAELHVHLEGTAPPALIKKLAERNGVTIPDALFAKEHFAWNNFGEFLETYDLACSVIKTVEDYRDITYEYLQSCHEQGCIYAELTASPDHALMGGLSYPQMIDGISKGIDDAREDFQIEARILIVFVRNFGIDSAIRIAKMVTENPNPYVVGVNMAGNEVDFPPALFKEAFDIAQRGKLQCTVHAGEFTGPNGIRQAMDSLPVTRLGHGVRAIEDDALVKEIIKREVTLEVCPGSNIALGVYKSYKEHPLRKLWDAGVKITLNSDDPPYFKTTIGQEYEIAQTEFGFSDDELLQVTRYAIEASFAEPALKQSLLEKLDAPAPTTTPTHGMR